MGCTGVLKRAQPGFQFANVKVSNSRVPMLMRIIIHAKCPRLQKTEQINGIFFCLKESQEKRKETIISLLISSLSPRRLGSRPKNFVDLFRKTWNG
jgi:hypothetical protein